MATTQTANQMATEIMNQLDEWKVRYIQHKILDWILSSFLVLLSHVGVLTHGQKLILFSLSG